MNDVGCLQTSDVYICGIKKLEAENSESKFITLRAHYEHE